MDMSMYVRSPQMTPDSTIKIDVAASTCTTHPFKMRVTGEYDWVTLLSLDMSDKALENLKYEVDSALSVRHDMKMAVLEELQEEMQGKFTNTPPFEDRTDPDNEFPEIPVHTDDDAPEWTL